MTKDVVIDLENIGEDYCRSLSSHILKTDMLIDDAYINMSVYSVFKEVATQIVLILDAPYNHEYYSQLQNIPDFRRLNHIEYVFKEGIREYFIELTLSLGFELYELVKKYVEVTDPKIEIFLIKISLRTLIIGVRDTSSNSVVEVTL